MIHNIEIQSVEAVLQQRQRLLQGSTGLGIADSVTYYYTKEGGFFSRKEQHLYLFFFQGLNTSPQNLSIFMRNQCAGESKNSKQKLTKGVFTIYDVFTHADCIVQINIPGNSRIFKLFQGKKQLMTNEEINTMYVSSMLRAFYEYNLPWGKCLYPYVESHDFLAEFKLFLDTFLRVVQSKDLNLGQEYEPQAAIKGSHACSIVLNYVQRKRLTRVAIEVLDRILQMNKQLNECPKICIFRSELYLLQGSSGRALQIVCQLLRRYPQDPYLLYYLSKYLCKLSLYDKAHKVLETIVQYNQLQTWLLLAEVHTQLRHFSHALVCLNHAARHTKCKMNKKPNYSVFESIGKVRPLTRELPLQCYPRMHVAHLNPLSIPVKDVEERYRVIINKKYWDCNVLEQLLYHAIQRVKYRVEDKKFQQLIHSTFYFNSYIEEPVSIKKGMTESMFMDDVSVPIVHSINNTHEVTALEDKQEDLPHFLEDDTSEMMPMSKPNRNLSIIPQIESVVENSNYDEKQKETNKKQLKLKREMNEAFTKVLTMVNGESEFEKAESEEDLAKILPVYNKLRTMSKENNYFTKCMFDLLGKSGNYKTILVLIAECLDSLEQRGMSKMQQLPYWIEDYIFGIIQEKGLKYLNNLLQNLKFYDEAVLDSIENAKKWGIQGIIS